jgi:hypothetical protein
VHHHKNWCREAKEAAALIDGSEAPIIDQSVTGPISGQNTGVRDLIRRRLVGYSKNLPAYLNLHSQLIEARPKLLKVCRILAAVALQDSLRSPYLTRPHKDDLMMLRVQ